MPKISRVGPVTAKDIPGSRYAVLHKTEDDYQQLLNSDMLAIDIETDSVDISTVSSKGVSVSTDGNKGYYLDDLEFLRPLLEDNNIPKIAHNASFDRSVIKKEHGIKIDKFYDTMIAAHLLEKHGLARKDRAIFDLDIMTFDAKDLKTDLGISPGTMSYEELAWFSCSHAVTEYKLFMHYLPQLINGGFRRLYFDILCPFIPAVSDMEATGALIDVDYLNPLGEYFDGKIKDITQEMNKMIGKDSINYNSSEQVSDLFFKVLKLSEHGIPTTKGKYDNINKVWIKQPRPSVNATNLQSKMNEHPIVPIYIEYKRFQQLKSHFVTGLLNKIDSSNRLHTQFNMCGTVTGRWSSSQPNLQNIPARSEEGRKVRKAFIAKPGCVLVKMDFSQLELRIMAALSKDPILMGCYLRGEDVHKRTAAEVFGIKLSELSLIRFIGKSINFMVGYGGGEEVINLKVKEFISMGQGISEQDLANLGTSASWIEKFWESYSGLAKWIRIEREKAWARGYVKTLMGRKRTIDIFEDAKAKMENKQDEIIWEIQRGKEISEAVAYNRIEKAGWYLREKGYREGINTIVQGSASEILSIGQGKVYSYIKDEPDTNMLIQVHDELVFETPEDSYIDLGRIIKREMAFNELSVPFPVELKVGKNWAEMKTFDVD